MLAVVLLAVTAFMGGAAAIGLLLGTDAPLILVYYPGGFFVGVLLFVAGASLALAALWSYLGRPTKQVRVLLATLLVLAALTLLPFLVAGLQAV